MIINRVSRVMGERRMSISEVARRSELAYTTVHDLYHGRAQRLDIGTLNVLCRTLNVESVADLLEYVPD